MQDIHSKLKPEIKNIINNESPDKKYILQIIDFYNRLQEELRKHPFAHQKIRRIDDEEILFMVYLKRGDWKNARRIIDNSRMIQSENNRRYIGANCYAIIKAIEGALCV